MKKNGFKGCFCSKEVIKRVILNLIQDLQRLPLLSLNDMRGRCQIKFGMTSLFNNGGFTLIELLVVVLIIGILAAVAVPQYQKAVNKSRFAVLISLVKAIADAKSEYYLATGEYARKFEVLSIDLHKNFTIVDDNSYGQIAVNSSTKQQILLDAGHHQVMGLLQLTDGYNIFYYLPMSEYKARTRCAGKPNSQAEQLCKNLPGAQFSELDGGMNWYNIL